MFWNEQVETLSRADMAIWQSHKLSKVIERVYEKSLLYSKHMIERGLQPKDIQTTADLAKLPFTAQQDLMNNYPYGLLTMPISGVSYIHTNHDGDEPIAICYTGNDMAMWTELMARMLVAGGVNVTTVFKVAISPEQYPESLGICYGARKAGAALVPGNSDQINRQLALIEDFGVNGIFSTPEYLLALAKEVRRAGGKPEELPLQILFSGMQPLTREFSEEIKKEYGKPLLEIYGLESVFGMGIGSECHYNNGLHLQEDCFYPEIIDPMSGQVLDIGERGELVLTSLSLEAMPIIRYRTGRHGYLDNNQCPCGRTLVRFQK